MKVIVYELLNANQQKNNKAKRNMAHWDKAKILNQEIVQERKDCYAAKKKNKKICQDLQNMT